MMLSVRKPSAAAPAQCGAALPGTHSRSAVVEAGLPAGGACPQRLLGHRTFESLAPLRLGNPSCPPGTPSCTLRVPPLPAALATATITTAPKSTTAASASGFLRFSFVYG